MPSRSTSCISSVPVVSISSANFLPLNGASLVCTEHRQNASENSMSQTGRVRETCITVRIYCSVFPTLCNSQRQTREMDCYATRASVMSAMYSEACLSHSKQKISPKLFVDGGLAVRSRLFEV